MTSTKKRNDKTYNEKASKILGTSLRNGRNKVINMLLFDFMKKSQVDVCFRCGDKIENLEDMSIDHKKPWMSSDDPKQLFYDLDNIAFSHLLCNSIMTGEKKSIGIGQRSDGKWIARIKHQKKDIYLGAYSTMEEAADAYDEAAVKYRGENTITNKKLRSEATLKA